MNGIDNNSLPSFQRILLATDFSPQSQIALHVASSLCKALHCKLTILHVFEYADAVPPETGGMLLELDSLYQRARVSIRSAVTQCESLGISSESLLMGGIPSEGILETITSGRIDLAVLGTSCIRGFERLVFGSTAEAVLRKSLCPILTVGPRVASSWEFGQFDSPIIFATDFDQATIPGIRFAASLSNATHAPLHCLHVLPLSVEGNLRSRLVPQFLTEALEQLTANRGLSIGPPTCAVTFGSEVSRAVVDYAAQHNASLIALGVRPASLVTAHLPAHVTYRIITESTCPVLTICDVGNAQPARPIFTSARTAS